MDQFILKNIVVFYKNKNPSYNFFFFFGGGRDFNPLKLQEIASGGVFF